MAAVALEAYEYEVKRCECVGICTTKLATVERVCVTDGSSEKYLAMYHDNLADANGLLQATTVVGKLDAFVGYLIRPAAFIGLLIFLI